MSTIHNLRPLKYRAIWISDVHLGSRGCRAEFLYDFLKSTECEQLYLVGDIVDLWSMQRSMFWPQSHNDVVRAILKKAKHGTRVTYIPGNHDAFLRDHEGLTFGNVTIRNEAIHETADGRRLLVIHGDALDKVVTCSRLMALLGYHGYDFLIWLNRGVNFCRRKLNLPYWSLANYLKHKVKNAVAHIRRFEEAVAHEAKRAGVDGVICGHLHRAELSHISGMLYCNDGDWIESCTALVESHDGTLQLLHWADEKHALKDDLPVAAVARQAA